VGLTWAKALFVGFPFILLVHTIDEERLKLPFWLASVARGGGSPTTALDEGPVISVDHIL
jgi:hypothetical protein